MTTALKSAAMVAFAAALPLPAWADDFQLWSAFSASGPVSDDSRVLVWFDGHARFRDDASDLGVSIIRPGLGWRVSDDVSVWAGYARVVSRQEGVPAAKENRIWQQATYRLGGALGGTVSGRTRLEQRLFESGEDTSWRARQMVRYARPFADTPFSAVVSNETFIAFNDTDWGAASGYDQSRNFIGVGYKAAGNVNLESGYMLNHIARENAPDAFNHVLSVSLSLSL